MSADATPAINSGASLLLTEDQASLGSTVRGFLEDRAAEPAVRRAMDSVDGIDRALWRDLGGLGACGLPVPERLGGAGATFVETAVVCEELGRSLACVPYMSSVVLAQTLLLDSADADAQARWLPGICSADTIATVALVEPDRGWDRAGQPAEGELRQRRLAPHRIENIRARRASCRRTVRDRAHRTGPDHIRR